MNDLNDLSYIFALAHEVLHEIVVVNSQGEMEKNPCYRKYTAADKSEACVQEMDDQIIVKTPARRFYFTQNGEMLKLDMNDQANQTAESTVFAALKDFRLPETTSAFRSLIATGFAPASKVN
jgi:hypothetical protein